MVAPLIEELRENEFRGYPRNPGPEAGGRTWEGRGLFCQVIEARIGSYARAVLQSELKVFVHIGLASWEGSFAYFAFKTQEYFSETN